MPEGVWEEIHCWRRSGVGERFAIEYFEMVAQKTGVAIDRYTYNEAGSVMTEISYKNNQIYEYTVKYYENDMIIRSVTYDENGIAQYMDVYAYNSNGKLSEMYHYS